MYVLLFVIDPTNGVNPKRSTLKKGQSETSGSEMSESETSQAELSVHHIFRFIHGFYFECNRHVYRRNGDELTLWIIDYFYSMLKLYTM